MGLFDGIKNIFAANLTDEQKSMVSENSAKFDAAVRELQQQYISAAAEKAFVAQWDPAYKSVKSLHISKRDPLYQSAQNFKFQYSQIHGTIAKLNASFIDREVSRCSALLSDIDGKSLDAQQRKVVVCDEDRNLVLAGAGSGKTLTIAAKVKYLCEEKGISPNDILLIAFTKKSAEEMTERISDRLGISVTATTFHKLGLDIISDAAGKRPDVLDDLTDFVSEYFNTGIMENAAEIKKIIEFFAYYLHIPADLDNYDSLGEAYEHEKGVDFATIKGQYESAKYLQQSAEERKTSRRTLQNEQVKSLDEVQIANFLFLNGVKYEYERLYPFESGDPARKAYRPDFYLPEYDLYLEHFGISRDGKVPWLPAIEEKKYLDDMAWKRAFHKENETKLLETYSYYSSEGRLLEELEATLKKHGVQFKDPDFRDIFDTVYEKASDKYFAEFIRLCCTFITLFKSNAFKVDDLPRLSSHNDAFNKPFFRKRTELFKDIVRPIITAYDAYLDGNNAIDFSDMINDAADLVAGSYAVHPYKWLIIDEFQDISVARYKLVKAILDRTGAKLLCVGDDWQSIYRFTGSDITLFTKFTDYFGQAAIMRLEQTYRNSQQLIDAAGAFVMKNPAQYKKQLRSSRSVSYPITFMCYQDNPFAVLQRTIDKIIHDFGDSSSILLLGRTNYDAQMLVESGLFTMRKDGSVIYNSAKNTPITFMSVHKAKGLEADNVVLLNFQNSTLGFPNRIADDPMLDLVLTAGDDYLYAEERRLLYVALTRTRNRIFILTDERKPSEFFKEFQPSDAVFILHTHAGGSANPIMCPRCQTGHLTVRKNESTNRYFVGCTNYPQCDYTVRDTSIMSDTKRCPECGGFLSKRRGKFGTFYGCSNYPTCSHTEQPADLHA